MDWCLSHISFLLFLCLIVCLMLKLGSLTGHDVQMLPKKQEPNQPDGGAVINLGEASLLWVCRTLSSKCSTKSLSSWTGTLTRLTRLSAVRYWTKLIIIRCIKLVNVSFRSWTNEGLNRTTDRSRHMSGQSLQNVQDMSTDAPETSVIQTYH